MEINKSLSKSAQLIQNALQERGMDQQVVELSETTRTAQDAATSLELLASTLTLGKFFQD